MHHPHTVTVIDIEAILDTIDVAQTVIIIAFECDRQV